MNDKKNLRLELFIVIALVLLTAAVYGQVLNFDFVNYDDHHYVRDNVMVQKALTWQGFLWAFTTTTMANWHPLTWLSHMLDVQLFGLSPGASSSRQCPLSSCSIRSSCSWSCRRMTGALWRSAFVAALFALHPLHVESVAWLAETKGCAQHLLLDALHVGLCPVLGATQPEAISPGAFLLLAGPDGQAHARHSARSSCC